jgi:hypothetical protein
MTKDTRVGSEDESVVSRLMTGFHGAGRLWRERVLPTLDSVNQRMRSAHDIVKSFSDDGQTLKDQWQALQDRVQLGASDAISGVRGIYQVSWDALSGLHPKVALTLIQLHRVEALATPRKALEVKQLVAAKEYFETLRQKSEESPKEDLTNDLAEMTRLLEAAREAVLKVPTTIGTLRPLFITVTGALSEIHDLVTQYNGQAGDYCAKFGKAAYTAPPDADAIAGLQTRYDQLAPVARSLEALDIAVALADLDDDVSKARQAYIDAVDKFAIDTQAVRSLEGFMTIMLESAVSYGCAQDAGLVAASQRFLTAVRKPPVDLVAAEAHKQAYVERLEELNPELKE